MVRGRPTGSRTAPSLRFRRHAYQNKSEKVNTTRTSRGRKSGSFLVFTPIGLAITLASVIAFLVLLWFFIFSNVFLVKNISITESTSLTQQQIREMFYQIQDSRSARFIPSNHILLIGQEEILAKTQSLYPFIESVENFQKDWPDKISLSFKEKQPVFLLQSGGQRWLLDKDGLIMGEPKGQLPANLVVMQAPASGQYAPGKKVEDLPVLNFALEMQNKWRLDWPFKPSQYEIVSQQGVAEMKISTSEGWYIKADNDESPEVVVKNLKLILDKEIPVELRSQLVYIDLRLANRAFYCLKDKACANR